MRPILLFIASIVLLACTDSDAPSDTTTTNKPAKTQTKTTTTDKKENALFDIEGWSAKPVQTISTGNVNDVLSSIGLQTKSQSPFLDFAGDDATKFILRGKQAEFLNIVNSLNYLEINWIKPETTDGAESKKVSLDNSKRVYQTVRGLLGDKGGVMVESMLTNPDFKAPDIINGKAIKLAKCEYSSCMLVIAK